MAGATDNNGTTPLMDIVGRKGDGGGAQEKEEEGGGYRNSSSTISQEEVLPPLSMPSTEKGGRHCGCRVLVVIVL